MLSERTLPAQITPHPFPVPVHKRPHKRGGNTVRKLLNTLFVLSEDSYLALDGENVLVLRGDETTARFPLHTLEGILSFSYKGASPALMGACAGKNISLAFLTPRGRFLARSCGESNGNVLLRRAQYRTADDPWGSCRMAQAFICGKLYNSRWVLELSLIHI